MNQNELIKVVIPMKLSWHYSAGKYFSRFVNALKEEGKILGIRCDRCKKTYLPPRPVCGDCFKKMDAWIDVGPNGVLKAFTVGYYRLLDLSISEPRPTPFGIGLIQLDGADTLVNHYIEETDIEKLKIGLRVKPVWRDVKKGYLTDIIYFKLIE